MRNLILMGICCSLVACTSMPLTGKWPETTLKRVELERVSLDSRIVVIEHVPRFLLPGSTGYGTMDSRFDHYFFWDFCRAPGFVWQMVVLRPDSRARSGWSFTRTVTVPPKGDRPGDTQVTEGLLRRKIAGYAGLRAAGLEFFKPGEIKCDAQYGDPLSA